MASFASLAVIAFFGSVEIARVGDEIAENSRVVHQFSCDQMGDKKSTGFRLASVTRGVHDKAHGKSGFPADPFGAWCR